MVYLRPILDTSGGSGVVVDMHGGRRTYIVAFYDGEPVLDAATMVAHAADDDDEANVNVGAVADALWRTVALADVSLRPSLLDNIASAQSPRARAVLSSRAIYSL